MSKMTLKTKQEITDTFKKYGYARLTKDNGEDKYLKNISFEKNGNSAHRIFIDTNIGCSEGRDEVSFLKVIVSPDFYKESAEDVSNGVEAYINQQSKINLHSSSNYKGFPNHPSYGSPCGKAYKVSNLSSLNRMLESLVH